MESRFIIGCDADGVLTDLSAHNIRAGEVAFKRKPANIDAYELDKMFDVDDIPKPIRYAKAFGIYKRYCKDEAPRNGASETIRSFSEQGYAFHAITARKFATADNALGKTARKWFSKWLDRFGISFNAVHFCDEKNSAREKLLACRKLGVDAMIEDKPDNALYLAENGIRVFMVHAPYNEDVTHENIIRVQDWADISQALQDLPASKEGGFARLDKNEIEKLTEEEKKRYFRGYLRHLQGQPFDEEKFARGDKRFKAIYRFIKPVAKLAFSVKAFDKENIPFQDGFIIACNHCDSSDQYRLGIALGNRPFVGYAAKEIQATFRGRLFDSTGLGLFIDRNDPADTKASAEIMASYIAHNRTALIFPEGTRKNKTQEGKALFQNRFKAGTAVLAQKTGTGILPVAVNSIGNNVLVRFGELMYVSPTDSPINKTHELERVIAKLSYKNSQVLLEKRKRFSELKALEEKYLSYIEETKHGEDLL